MCSVRLGQALEPLRPFFGEFHRRYPILRGAFCGRFVFRRGRRFQRLPIASFEPFALLDFQFGKYALRPHLSDRRPRVIQVFIRLPKRGLCFGKFGSGFLGGRDARQERRPIFWA